MTMFRWPVLVCVLMISGAAHATVTTSKLDCRERPTASSPIVEQIPSKSAVKVIEHLPAWAKIERNTASCWVASRHLAESATPDQAQAKSPAPSSRTTPPVRRDPPKERASSATGSCPCSGGSVCVGPRGGRYCITSSGKKRYGV